MTKADILAAAKHKLLQHGLWQYGWRTRWDKKSPNEFAYCLWGEKIIGLREDLAVYPDIVITDTICHEVAHALIGPDLPDHGRKFKEMFFYIGGIDVGTVTKRHHWFKSKNPERMG